MGNGYRLIQGHAPETLKRLPEGSVHCVVTSPPYYGLRSYKIEPVPWPDGWVGHLGMEPRVEDYIEHLVAIFQEVRRVLHPTGTVWVNLSDSYAGSGQGWSKTEKQVSSLGTQWLAEYGYDKPPGYISSPQPNGLKPLDLCGVPERFALAMQADGWWWRDRIAYCKTSAMPESVAGWRWERCRVKAGSHKRNQYSNPDRPFQDHSGNTVIPDAQWADCSGCPKCSDNGGYILRKGSWRTTRAWEYIFMFTKTAEYACFQEQVREAQTGGTHSFGTKLSPPREAAGIGHEQFKRYTPNVEVPGGRNPRSWWVQPAPKLMRLRRDLSEADQLFVLGELVKREL